MAIFTGAGVAIVTPFHEDESINYDRLDELIDFHCENGTDCIIICGTTGESATMTEEEHLECVKFAIDRAKGRIPVIAGTGSNCTRTAVELSKEAADYGADGLLVITPYYNKASKAGMVNHFMQVADAVHTPVYVYNVPGRTGVSLTYEALAEISQHKNIVGIKEASGNMSLICQFSKLINENFNVYSGNDDINVALMSMGGAGSISVMANILPKEVHDIAMACQNGDFETARKMQLKYLDFINALFIETNPIPIKEAMNMAGLNVGGYRLPLCPMADDTKAVLKAEMEKLGII